MPSAPIILVPGFWLGAWAWDDVVIEFKPNDMTSLMVGNIKAAGLENMTSTRFISFLDRGPYGDIAVDSRPGRTEFRVSLAIEQPESPSA